MAISINTVYQRVLALANKEQRGYITPQEFNLYANQAQLEILNQYFYDTNQFGRISGNDTQYCDMLELLHEKLNVLTVSVNLAQGNGNFFIIPEDAYKIGTVTHVLDRVSTEIEPVNENEYVNMSISPLTSPTLMRPIYYLRNTSIIVNPSEITKIDVNYIKKPTTVQWNGYNTPSGQLYNETESTNFELHPSEEPNLVLNILKLAGIAMKDPSLYQLGAAEEAKDIQQEKQ